MEIDAMASLPSRVRRRKPSTPPVVTGTLTVGAGTFLHDLLNESAVLTVNDPKGRQVFWVGAIVDGGRIVGLQLRRFNTGELFRITFDGGRAAS
jgi:hypothetical protein